jgi:hypothetical protein
MCGLQLRGGVWKNSEDELLKAAIMKYGTNNWARVASLIPRKTAAQCKARWYNWLHPSIKKTEWTREEDERLLYLAKTRATQWRTIASLVGRTPAQCLERYEKLLDEAAASTPGGLVSSDAKDDPRKLRPGERDPHPETRPARPDPVDMDDDELEMLAEARARLANTKGKKAKRKAREKQLQRAKQVATLQKMRELRAAGITVRQKRRRGQVDYSKEIPFPKSTPAGFFDTTDEDVRAVEQKGRSSSTDYEGKDLAGVKDRQDMHGAIKRQREESESRKREQAALDLPSELAAESKANDPVHVAKRVKLSLPAPQLSERELELVSRLGMDALDDASTVRDGASTMMPPPSRALYSRNAVMEEARNQVKLRSRENPLMGGANVELEAGIQSVALPGASSSSSAMDPRTGGTYFTPNPLASRLHALAGSVTPHPGVSDAASEVGDSASVYAGRVGSVAGKSVASSWSVVTRGGHPLSDRLGINRTPAGMASSKASVLEGETDSVVSSQWGDAEADMVAALTVLASGVKEVSMTKQERRALKEARKRVGAQLAALPQPQYDFEVVVEDDQDHVRSKVESVDDTSVEASKARVASRLRGEDSELDTSEDTDELDRRRAQARAAAERAEWERRSTALKHPDGLPRPPPESAALLTARLERAEAHASTNVSKLPAEKAVGPLINAEVFRLVRYEAFRYPVQGAKGAPLLPEGNPPEFTDLDDGELQEAKRLIEREGDGERLDLDAGESPPLWLPSSREWFVPTDGTRVADIDGTLPPLPLEGVAEALRHQHDSLASFVAGEERKISKRLQRLSESMGVMVLKSKQAERRLQEAHQVRSARFVELVAYSKLLKAEEVAASVRQAQVEQRLEGALAREQELQRRFSALKSM